MRLVTALMITAAAVLLPSLAHAGNKQGLTASRGTIEATVTFKGSTLFARAVRITVTRAGTPILDRVKVRDARTGEPTSSGPSAIAVSDLNGDGEPEVLLDMYSGGAHCCSFTRIYQFDAAYADYTWSEHGWGTIPTTCLTSTETACRSS